MLESGNKNRTQHPTDANAESSRSHAVFQVYVKQRDRTANTTTNIKVGKLSLIDLAGSERASVTKNRGARFQEGSNINRSLLALGNCINALADGKPKGYVPYRNSKLTRLLKDSLGGNCRTVMIAAISPSSLSYEDTYNTLKYANRAKEIKVDLKQNSLEVENHLSQYPKMVRDLRQQVADLQAKLLNWETGKMQQVPKETKIVAATGNDQLSRLRASVQQIFDGRVNIRKELMELEGSERILALKIHKKQLTLGRLGILVDQTDHCNTIGELQRSVSAAEQRMKRISGRKAALLQRMADNEQQLVAVEADISKCLQSSGATQPEGIELLMRCRHVEIDLRDTRQQAKYLKKIARIQQRESVASEKLVCSLLRTARHNYYVLKGHGLATDAMMADFTALQLLLRGSSEVAWQDQDEAQTSNTTSTTATSSAGVWSDNDFEKLLAFPVLGYRVSPPASVPHTMRSVPSSSTPASRTISRRDLPDTSAVADDDVCNRTYTVLSDKLLGCSPCLRPLAETRSVADPCAVGSFSGASDAGVPPGPPSTAVLCQRPACHPAVALNDAPCPPATTVAAATQSTSPADDIENMSPPNKPAFIGKLTFADVVKSPAVIRSPLASRENLMQNNNINNSAARPQLWKEDQSKLTSCSNDPLLEVLKTCDAMTKMGRSRPLPSYMQMTRSATYRSQGMPRSNSVSLADALKQQRALQQQFSVSRIPSQTNTHHSKPLRISASSSNIHINGHQSINSMSAGVAGHTNHRRALMF